MIFAAAGCCELAATLGVVVFQKSVVRASGIWTSCPSERMPATGFLKRASSVTGAPANPGDEPARFHADSRPPSSCRHARRRSPFTPHTRRFAIKPPRPRGIGVAGIVGS